jgi:hypothetical protein
MHRLEICLVSATTRDQNHHASHQGQNAKDGRDRNGVVFFLGGLDGPKIYNFLLRRVGEALIGEGHKTDDQEYNADNSFTVHKK